MRGAVQGTDIIVLIFTEGTIIELTTLGRMDIERCTDTIRERQQGSDEYISII